MATKQLCWTCKKPSTCGCDWIKKLKPINGWNAEIVPFEVSGWTYAIKDCPEYQFEDANCENCAYLQGMKMDIGMCRTCAYSPLHKGNGDSNKESSYWLIK